MVDEVFNYPHEKQVFLKKTKNIINPKQQHRPLTTSFSLGKTGKVWLLLLVQKVFVTQLPS